MDVLTVVCNWCKVELSNMEVVDTITQEELQAIKEMAEKATPGPWIWWEKRAHGGWTELQVESGDELMWTSRLFGGIGFANPDDADFISTSREAVPKLVSEVERLRALFEKLQRVTGQSVYFPIEYESFVLNIAREGLNGGK